MSLHDVPEAATGEDNGCDYRLITTKEQLDELCSEMIAAPLIAVDTETEGLKFSDVIVGVCISTEIGTGRYIPIRHCVIDGVRFEYQLDPRVVFEAIGPILESKPLTGHNFKFDRKAFLKEGINPNYIQDTLIDAHLTGKFKQGRRSLDALVLQLYGYQMTKLKDLFQPKKGRRKVEIRPAELDPEAIRVYGCEDADYSLRLAKDFKPLVDSSVAPNIRELEMRLISVVADMEMQGVPADLDFLERMSAEVAVIIDQLEGEIIDEIRVATGDPDKEISLTSPAQLATLLYDDFGIPCVDFTPAGARSTAGVVLKELAKEHEIVERILTYRALFKLKRFTLDKMQLRVEEDGRVRGGFNQVGTESGRFSSQEPNLQQIPKDQVFFLWPVTDDSEAKDVFSELIRQEDDGSYVGYDDESGVWKSSIYFGAAPSGTHYGVHHGQIYQTWKCSTRDFIRAKEGHYVLEADYSQVELRILAGESQEQTFLSAFEENDDVHLRTAGAIHRIPLDQVTKAQRSTGKTINFGLLYGMGPQKLAASLLITTEEAKELMSTYFQNLPRIKTWINDTKSEARRDMYSRTAFGRIRRFPEIQSYDGGTRAREEREAVNHCIQGAAADVMKLALCRLDAMLRAHFGDRVRIVLTVHDSVMLECEDSCSPEDVAAVLLSAMRFKPIPTWPMLDVDIGYGESWGQCKDLHVPEGHPMPPKCTDELPKIRVRQVARERDGDPSIEPYFSPLDSSLLETDKKVVLEETVTSEPLPQPEEGEYRWVLAIKEWPTAARFERLKEVISSYSDPNGKHTLSVKLTDGDGYEEQEMVPGKFTFTQESEAAFRIIAGPCTLSQDIDDIDPDEVIRRMAG